MPVDKARYGSFDKLREDTELQLKAIIEDVANSTDAAPGSEKSEHRPAEPSERYGFRSTTVNTSAVSPL